MYTAVYMGHSLRPDFYGVRRILPLKRPAPRILTLRNAFAKPNGQMGLQQTDFLVALHSFSAEKGMVQPPCFYGQFQPVRLKRYRQRVAPAQGFLRFVIIQKDKWQICTFDKIHFFAAR